MPWQEVSTVSLRQEFVMLASVEGANVRAWSDGRTLFGLWGPNLSSQPRNG